MTPRSFRVSADAYGVHVTIHVEHRDGATPEELHRALTAAVNAAKDRHQQAHHVWLASC